MGSVEKEVGMVGKRIHHLSGCVQYLPSRGYYEGPGSGNGQSERLFRDLKEEAYKEAGGRAKCLSLQHCCCL